MARQNKTPLGERNTNIEPKKASQGKNTTKSNSKENNSNELIDAANKITKTHSKKRPLEEDGPTATQNPIPSPPPSAQKQAPFSSELSKVSHVSDSAPEPDSDDDLIHITYNANQIRTKLRAIINGGEMKVGELTKALDVSGNSYRTFMGQSGPNKGIESNTFIMAQKFLQEREKRGIKTARAPKKAKDNTETGPASKKAKTGKDAEAEKYDVSDILLEGEDSGTTPIYDTCDDLRTKMNAYLRLSWTSQAGLARAAAETFTVAGDTETKCDGSHVRRFLEKKGPDAGAKMPVFYAAYVFFEKVRIKQKKNKSKKRLEMEKEHGPNGMSRETDANTGYLTTADHRPYVDKYGKTHFR